MGLRIAIYTRLSKDPDGSQTATDRQEADCRAVAKVRGWEVAGVYSDVDLSAFERRRIDVRGKDQPVSVRLVPDSRELPLAQGINFGG